MGMTAAQSIQAPVGQTERLTAALVTLIQRQRLSVAAAARTVGLTVETAGTLVRLWAIERDAAEEEAEERLEDIQRMCPGEDWWSYGDRQLSAIEHGSAIPNRIVRELVDGWCKRTDQTTGRLAWLLGIGDEALRRSLGLAATPANVRNGRHRPARVRKTITVQAAGRIVRALGIPPCEVPGYERSGAAGGQGTRTDSPDCEGRRPGRRASSGAGPARGWPHVHGQPASAQAPGNPARAPARRVRGTG
jgi:hypothetical protein